jgi:hypothetical protein
MLRHQFWLFEYISISEILLQAPAKYALAFLYAETDGNDLTYFIIHHSFFVGLRPAERSESRAEAGPAEFHSSSTIARFRGTRRYLWS